jgi:CDP-diacylglycerol--glycerol-3-phosphate 3-phosphatidyltransferase
MVVVILGRELLVTSLRGLAEGGGQSFGAAFSGKLKMVFQSVTILIILVYVNYTEWLQHGEHRHVNDYFRLFRDAAIWATLAITVVSGALYCQRAVKMYRKSTVAA